MAITTMESYPLSWGLLQNYSFDIEDEEQIIQKLHELEWENINQVSNSFSLVKNQVRLEDFKSEESRYDVIFFDAFAPNKQEEIWSEGNLSKMYNVLRVGGCLVTYCAKGEIRRRFEKVGFKVSRIEGPPGKREMLRCEKV